MALSWRKIMGRLLLASGLIALVAGGAFASHGGGEGKPAAEAIEPAPAPGEQKAEEGGEEAKKKDPPPPQYKLGDSLKGYYDRSLLRYTARLSGMRYKTGKIELTLGQRPWRAHVRLDLAIEFGQESGMAELQTNWNAMQEEIQNTVGRLDPRELILPTGKWRLKESLVAQFNRRLETAKVRNVYITDFIMQRQ